MKLKTEIYSEERLILLNKLFEILNINDKNNTFFLSDLDKDLEKQTQILQLESDIRTCFVCGNWACFTNNNIKRKVLSIIKNLIIAMHYNIMSKRILIKKENNCGRDTIYYIIKNNSI